MRELSAQPQGPREGQGTAAKQQLGAVPCPSLPPLLQLIHINDQHTNFQFGKLRIINGNNFLFGLIVYEILKKTFILDSHWPFIGSVQQNPDLLLGAKFYCKIHLRKQIYREIFE
jgi:hypothetical protein